MLDRGLVLDNLRKYDTEKIKIGVLASHSALDVCDGAVEEGFTHPGRMPGRPGQDLYQIFQGVARPRRPGEAGHRRRCHHGQEVQGRHLEPP